ncbi:hypothetical protein M9H77_01516 [Catharanthus roseus]|uniref:Uncharacterized protein n=1 Tax=Catharanthus roseus TaxID=4058 RepID=A0ACC0C5W1_CATRO|nr:hypothetical protein M9H77_01516 [Catharanthus roseus]
MNMDATHPVRVVLFWDSEHAKDAYDYDISSESDKDNNPNDEKDDISTPLNPLSSTTVNQWPSSQWFSNAPYDYTSSGAFIDMGSGEQIDDLIESDTIRLLDWNDAMTDIQLSMRFVDKIQANSVVHQNKHRNTNSKFISKLISHLVANDPEISVSNFIQEVQVLLQTDMLGKWQEYTLRCSLALARNLQKNITIQFLSGWARGLLERCSLQFNILSSKHEQSTR